MPIALVTGPANAGKAHVVLDAVRRHLAHGEHPLLVVPTEADQARYRRELVEAGSGLGVRVERFEGLLALVAERAQLGEARIGQLARERILASLAGARPGMASALARTVAELETQRISPARLRGALDAAGAELATLERLCDVYERYRAALRRIGRADRELRVTRALDELRRKPALWGGAPVLLYGFDDLAELQLDAIETLGGVVGARVTVSLAYEAGRVVFAGRAGAFQRLAPLADSHTELDARADYYAPAARDALHHLERSLLGGRLGEDAEPVEPVEAGGAVRLLEGGGPRAEFELLAGEVRALLDGGMPAEEIAIVHRAPSTVAGLLGEVLERYDIPYSMRRRQFFAHSALGRALLGLLRCATGDGQVGDLLAWLRAPGVLERAELADRLEASARRRGVRDAGGARELWETDHWPLERIDRVREAAAAGLPALADVLVGELERLFCAPRRSESAVLGADELAEARALVAGRGAIEQLRDLARAAPELAPSPGELTAMLARVEFDEDRRSGGWADDVGGGAVAVVDPLSLRARRVRMVFLCGLVEGVFPAPGRPHPLLGEEDRRRLAHESGLLLRAEPDALAAERYLLYALASRPEERLTLSWHTAGEDGTPLAPSLFVDDICDLFSPALRETTLRRPAGAAPGESLALLAQAFAAAGRGAPPDSSPLAELASLGGETGAVSGPIQPPREERVLAALRERALWSASSLESWAGCPVRWFVERLLRGERIDPDPEPLARGALAHAVCKQVFERLRERTGSARLTPASVGLAKRLLGEALEEQQRIHPLSLSPERVPGARRRLAAELERYLESAAELASPLEPTYLELEFGFEGESLPALELGEGVSLRGRIDRVDVGPGGEAVVYDYKARSAPPSAKWVGERRWQVALYMRAVRDLLGHAPVGGFYQPLAGKDIRARGALADEGGVELDVVRTDRLDGGELERLLDECLAAARVAAGEARAGALAPRPDTCASGGGCAYPAICRCER